MSKQPCVYILAGKRNRTLLNDLNLYDSLEKQKTKTLDPGQPG